jgi:hypothetical protein
MFGLDRLNDKYNCKEITLDKKDIVFEKYTKSMEFGNYSKFQQKDSKIMDRWLNSCSSRHKTCIHLCKIGNIENLRKMNNIWGKQHIG